VTSTPSSILSVRDVSVRLSGREVLHRVGLRMEAGQLMGLIGANGAGKTTLLRAILGLIPVSSGEILVEGPAGRGRDRAVGYVPQRVTLEQDVPLRARDLVGLGIDGNRFGFPFPSRRRSRLIDEMLDAVDASAFGNSRLGLLSGGEQQRILIAHALISSPRLLLLDEPLSNLDIASEQKIVEVLDRVAHQRGIAVLISTHDMNPLLDVMDRVAYIADGRLASGTTDEVVTTESLSRLYGQHVDVIRVHDRVIVVAGREGKEFKHTGKEPVTAVV